MMMNDPRVMSQVARFKIEDDIRRAEEHALAREARRTAPPRPPRAGAAELARELGHRVHGWASVLHLPHRAHV